MPVGTKLTFSVRSVTRRPLSPDAVQMLDDIDRAENALGVGIIRINIADMASEIVRKALVDVVLRFGGPTAKIAQNVPFHRGGYVNTSRPSCQPYIDMSLSTPYIDRN